MFSTIRSTLRDKEMMHAIFTLAWPTITEQALHAIVSYADTAQVGAIGAHASASVGLTSTMMWLINSPMSAMSMGVLSCIAKARGAGDQDRVRRSAIQSIIITIVLGVVLGIITLAISPFLPKWLGADEEIRRDASIYFSIICAPMLFRASSIIFGSVLRSTGDAKTPMIINTAMNFINIILNFLFINPSRTITVFGHSIHMWGADLGVTGAAIATAIAFIVGGVFMAICALRNPVLGLRGQKLKYDKEIMTQCIRVGMPIAAARVGSSLGQVVFTMLIAKLGTISIAAHSIAITAEQAFYIPGFGMQTAAATLTGHSAGAKDERKLIQYCQTIMAIAVLLMGSLAVILFCFSDTIMGFFTPDAEVIALGAKVLRIVAVSEPFYAATIILEGTFNGVGETKLPFIITISTMWGVRILFTWLCVGIFKFGLISVWVCMVADNLSRFACLVYLYTRGKWKKRLGLIEKTA